MPSKDELKETFVTGAVPSESDFHDLIDVAGTKGAKGDKGDPGEQGPQGEQGPAGADGTDGADGFGTEEQYNALVARIEALEGGE